MERRIREAQEQGAFDGLAGAGKPLKGLHRSDDENWWLRSYLEREGLPTDALLPPPLRLRKEVERLPETVRGFGTEEDVRAVVRELNLRVAAYVRNPTSARLTVRPASADEIVAGWRAAGPAKPPAADHGVGAVPEGERRYRRLAFWRRTR